MASTDEFEFIKDENAENRRVLVEQTGLVLTLGKPLCAVLVVVFLAGVAFLQINTKNEIQSSVEKSVPPQVEKRIGEELTKGKVEQAIDSAVRRKTEAEWQEAVNLAVAKELTNNPK